MDKRSQGSSSANLRRQSSSGKGTQLLSGLNVDPHHSASPAQPSPMKSSGSNGSTSPRRNPNPATPSLASADLSDSFDVYSILKKDDQKRYDFLWYLATNSSDNSIPLGGAKAVSFFEKSGLDVGALRQIWSRCTSTPTMNRSQFNAALRYISMVQNGYPISRGEFKALLSKELLVPKFQLPVVDGALSIDASSSMGLDPSDAYALLPEEHKRYYQKLWSIACPCGEEVLGGGNAVRFFEKSGLDVGSLKQIWSRCTTNPVMNKSEFFIALRYISMTQCGFPISRGEFKSMINVLLPVPGMAIEISLDEETRELENETFEPSPNQCEANSDDNVGESNEEVVEEDGISSEPAAVEVSAATVAVADAEQVENEQAEDSNRVVTDIVRAGVEDITDLASVHEDGEIYYVNEIQAETEAENESKIESVADEIDGICTESIAIVEIDACDASYEEQSSSEWNSPLQQPVSSGTVVPIVDHVVEDAISTPQLDSDSAENACEEEAVECFQANTCPSAVESSEAKQELCVTKQASVSPVVAAICEGENDQLAQLNARLRQLEAELAQKNSEIKSLTESISIPRESLTLSEGHQVSYLPSRSNYSHGNYQSIAEPKKITLRKEALTTDDMFQRRINIWLVRAGYAVVTESQPNDLYSDSSSSAKTSKMSSTKVASSNQSKKANDTPEKVSATRAQDQQQDTADRISHDDNTDAAKTVVSEGSPKAGTDTEIVSAVNVAGCGADQAQSSGPTPLIEQPSLSEDAAIIKTNEMEINMVEKEVEEANGSDVPADRLAGAQAEDGDTVIVQPMPGYSDEVFSFSSSRLRPDVEKDLNNWLPPLEQDYPNINLEPTTAPAPQSNNLASSSVDSSQSLDSHNGNNPWSQQQQQQQQQQAQKSRRPSSMSFGRIASALFGGFSATNSQPTTSKPATPSEQIDDKKDFKDPWSVLSIASDLIHSSSSIVYNKYDSKSSRNTLEDMVEDDGNDLMLVRYNGASLYVTANELYLLVVQEMMELGEALQKES